MHKGAPTDMHAWLLSENTYQASASVSFDGISGMDNSIAVPTRIALGSVDDALVLSNLISRERLKEHHDSR